MLLQVGRLYASRPAKRLGLPNVSCAEKGAVFFQSVQSLHTILPPQMVYLTFP